MNTLLHRAALRALGAAILCGTCTPLAKQLMGDGAVLPFVLAGLLYLGLSLLRLVRDRGWKPADLPRGECPWMSGAIGFGGVLGPGCWGSGLPGLGHRQQPDP